MAITGKLKAATPAAQKFIDDAPDSKPGSPKKSAGRRPITITVPLELLEKIDAIARKTDQSRAALIILGMHEITKQPLFKE